MSDATLRARVQAVIIAHGAPDTLTDAVLAAIPEPAPVVRSHTWKDAGWDKKVLVDETGRVIARIDGGLGYTVNAYLTHTTPYERLGEYDSEENAKAACLALRDGADAKDAQIAALKDEVERYRHEYEQACGTIAAMHAAAVGEVTGPKRGVVEDVRDVHAEVERLRTLIAALTQRAEAAERENAHYDIKVELAALKTKAGTPTCLHDWHSYSDTAGTHSRCLRCGMVPGLEAPPTPAERPVIGACVVKDGLMQVDYTYPYRSQLEHVEAAHEHVRKYGGTVYQLLRGEVVP